MNWDAIGAITGIIAFLLTLFIEWPRVKTRWLEAVSVFSPALTLIDIDRFITLSGYVTIIGLSLMLSSRVWSYEYLILSGRIIFTLGCLSLGCFLIWESRLKACHDNDKSSSFYDVMPPMLVRFVSIYLVLFGMVAGVLAVWDLIRWVQQ